MRRSLALLVLTLFTAVGLTAREKPRLVLVISIDQLPFHYLTKFSPHFGRGGFRLLTEDGAVYPNAHYTHAFTLTGPGHAVISTGCAPAQHGIVGNNWFDRASGKTIYSAEDSTVRTLGTQSPGRSPANLRVTTIGDALRMSSGFRSRVISISQKDRAAIFMGGKMPNAAYWLDDSSFVSSSFYMDSLPEWVDEFNRNGLATSFTDSVWNRLLPEEAYAVMDRDDAPYEGDVAGLGRTFPHSLAGVQPAKYLDALWHTPFLNDLMLAFVKQAIMADSLGRGSSTDMLFIGLSANDAVGHTFGPESHEILDMTVRTDRLLADLFGFVDQWIGLDNAVLVLTSDHGIPPIPEYVLSQYPSADVGRIGSGSIKTLCESFLDHAFGSPGKKMSWIDRVVDGGIYINRKAVVARKQALDRVIASLADSLRQSALIGAVLTGPEAVSGRDVGEIEGRLRRSYFAPRSGDLVFALRPFYLDHGGTTGTDHGQPYEYDTHVPVIIRGDGVVPGFYYESASPEDIAPTLSALLEIDFPPAAEGRVLKEALRGR
jgi:predicted AlkP superfamily pyrophosphatase or phosphodiesterase